MPVPIALGPTLEHMGFRPSISTSELRACGGDVAVLREPPGSNQTNASTHGLRAHPNMTSTQGGIGTDIKVGIGQDAMVRAPSCTLLWNAVLHDCHT